MRFVVDRLDHLVLNCRDIEVTASWFQRVLGMEREEYGEHRRTALRFGGQKVNLRPLAGDAAGWTTASAVAAGSADLCFVTTLPPPEVAAHLRDCGVAIEEGPVEREGALGPMTSHYVRDPDGNLIEIATYAEG